MIYYMIALLLVNAVVASDYNIVFGDAPEGLISPEVVGGKEAPVGKYGYTAGIRSSADGQSFCGGTLISKTHVITAAHCVEGGIKYVSVGTHYNNGSIDGEQIKVANVTSHPKFNSPMALAHDIAIVTLAGDASEKITVAHLGEDEPQVGQNARLHGWGRVSYPGPGSHVLKEVNLEIIGNRDCQLKLGRKIRIRIHSSMICAGGVFGQAACHGDSGGPLVLSPDSKHPVLVGAVSFGKPCGTGAPDAFARISSLKDFIDQHATGHTWVKTN